MKTAMRYVGVCLLLCLGHISSIFASGPFGIEMGMSLAEVEQVCKSRPKHIGEDAYEIVPPKTNHSFTEYTVWIDPDYGVYWLKAIGKNIYTNGYGYELKSAFNDLVRNIRNIYGEENISINGLKSDSHFADPQNFMYTLGTGERRLGAIWYEKKAQDILMNAFKDSTLVKKNAEMEELRNFIDTIAFNEGLPGNISVITVECKTDSPLSKIGYVILDYTFSNTLLVEQKANSVF